MHAFSMTLLVGLGLAAADAGNASSQPVRVAKPDGANGPIAGCFGSSVALSGNVAFVGDPCEGGQGAVYRLRRRGAGWIVDARIEAPAEPPITGGFGASIALNGNVLGIGAPQGGKGGYVYQTGNILAEPPSIAEGSVPSASTYAGFGASVAAYRDSLSGSPFLAGASAGGCPSGLERGFVMGVPEGMRTYVCAPTQLGEWAGFGQALASHANSLLIGAPSIGPPLGAVGTGYLYDLGIPGLYAPSLQAVFVPTDPDPNRRFGRAIDMNASVVVFGAPTTTVSTPGNVWVYEGASANWKLAATLAEPASQPASTFGSSVALGADVLWIGSPSSGGGAIYEYARSSAGWSLSARVEAQAQDNFGGLGTSLALDRATWIAGAPSANAYDSQHWTGAVYLSSADYLFEGGFDR